MSQENTCCEQAEPAFEDHDFCNPVHNGFLNVGRLTGYVKAVMPACLLIQQTNLHSLAICVSLDRYFGPVPKQGEAVTVDGHVESEVDATGYVVAVFYARKIAQAQAEFLPLERAFMKEVPPFAKPERDVLPLPSHDNIDDDKSNDFHIMGYVRQILVESVDYETRTNGSIKMMVEQDGVLIPVRIYGESTVFYADKIDVGSPVYLFASLRVDAKPVPGQFDDEGFAMMVTHQFLHVLTPPGIPDAECDPIGPVPKWAIEARTPIRRHRPVIDAIV